MPIWASEIEKHPISITKRHFPNMLHLGDITALDGGKILFLVINALSMLVIRRRIPQKFESYVHVAGFALLMLLMLAVTFQDVWKIFQ